MGLDCGPMSGFDSGKVDQEFFPVGRNGHDINQDYFSSYHVKSNFFCSLGYADTSKIFPRNPRLLFAAAIQLRTIIATVATLTQLCLF